MFTVGVTEEQRGYVREQLRRFDFGKRGEFDGTPADQEVGLIGQTVLADLLGVARPDGRHGCDGGVDFELFGRRFDVKTMGRNHDPRPAWVNNFVGLQKRLRAEVFLFCSYNRRSGALTVCGWLEKEMFLKRAVFVPKGGLRHRDDGSTFAVQTDHYEISNTALHTTDSPTTLRAALAAHFAADWSAP